MELFASDDAYVIIGDKIQKTSAVYCCRNSGKLSVTDSSILCQLSNAECLGIVHCVIGRIGASLPEDFPYLLLATEVSHVGYHPLSLHEIFRIDSVAAYPLVRESELYPDDYRNRVRLEKCLKHSDKDPRDIHGSALTLFHKGQKKFVKGTVESFRFVANQVSFPKEGSKKREYSRISENSNRKLIDEILRLFNEEESFYYCAKGGDLTNSLQQLSENNSENHVCYDGRFFWNKYLLQDLYDLPTSVSSDWVVPVIQGFVAIEKCCLEAAELELILISRRSVERAGTRYIKRGIDSDGNCANYVETEQVLKSAGHCLACLQVRGSVPLFWHQSGFKYRPPPRISKSKDESLAAFRTHISEQIGLYGDPLIFVNLVDQLGREGPLGEAFLDHAIDFDSESVVYVAFDFHDQCRGLRFDRLRTLVDVLADSLREMRFTWIDKKGVLVCRQKGVFRVNCVDCLDRTNVAQTAFARAALGSQLLKMGLMTPEESLSQKLLAAHQHMWADNGDSISHQYAGTAALKGDFTRRGQRNLAGLFRDGYHSASRYYLCHVRDARRQAAINAVLGRTEEELMESSLEEATEQTEELHEDLRLLVQECQRFFLPESEILLGGWALIDADPGTGQRLELSDMDTVILLTKNAYYCAEYDEDMDKFTDCRRVPLQWIVGIETGRVLAGGGPFRKHRNPGHGPTVVRISYRCSSEDWSGDPYCHVWRAGSTRLFNNMAIAIKTSEEADEYVRAIAEQFRVALELANSSASLTHLDVLKLKKGAQESKQQGKGKVSRFLSDFTQAGGAVRAKIVGAHWNPLSSFRRKALGSRKNLTDSFESGKVHKGCHAISSEGGILFSCVPDLKDMFPNVSMVTEQKRSFSEDYLRLCQMTDCSTRPVFTLTTESNTTSPPHPLTPRDGSHLLLQPASSFVSLGDSRVDPIDSQSQECVSRSIKTSRSEGMLGKINVTHETSANTTNSPDHFVSKLASGSGKLLGSFSKLSSQVHSLGTNAQKTFRLGSSGRINVRKNPFESFRHRISSSRTKIILL